MFLIFDLVIFIYALLYLPYLLITKRGFAGYSMRFGLFTGPVTQQIKAKANIWVHAVSVGEVMVIDGFIDRLKEKYPAYQIIATVTTKTGYTLARERLKNKAIVIPSPIDFSFVARRFVSLISPKIYIAAETEIWPNLYGQLYRRHIPIVVINGRISDTSCGRYKAIRPILKGILNQVELWCMQSQKDADRIMELGAQASRVSVTGNIKFDDAAQAPDVALRGFDIGQDELWWVAGSTHPGEEEILLDVYSKLINKDPNWRLVIAPRHVERASQIKDLVSKRGLKSVIVVDTIGQLRSLYALASLVFVGKSLCVGGGHNIIEPAVYGKAIVIGPMVTNFRDIVACFKDAKAIVQVKDTEEFEHEVLSLCADPSRREILGNAAHDVIAANQGAASRSLEKLARLIL